MGFKANDRMNLSIICVFHDQQDLVESSLQAIFAIINEKFELIIIDDGSTDGTYEQILATSKPYNSDSITILRHESSLGKGISFNKAASLASKDILWLVERVDQINPVVLKQHLRQITKNGYQGLLLSEEPLYQEIETWVENINNGYLLSNEHYLWNWKAIPQHHRFFNPYQSDLHCIELSIRLATQSKIVQAPLFFEPVINKNRLSTISSNRAEILVSLFRERKVSVEQSDLLLSQLKLRDKKFGVDTTNRDTGDLIYEAKALIAEGYNSDALDICNKLHELYPDNVEVITLKIQVLNRLHRYVEAAELKYEINHRYGINLAIPKATPKISLVVPDEITAEDDASLVQKKVFPPPLEQLLISPPDSIDDIHPIEDLPESEESPSLEEVEHEPAVTSSVEPQTIEIRDTEWESDNDLIDEIALELESELVRPRTDVDENAVEELKDIQPITNNSVEPLIDEAFTHNISTIEVVEIYDDVINVEGNSSEEEYTQESEKGLTVDLNAEFEAELETEKEVQEAVEVDDDINVVALEVAGQEEAEDTYDDLMTALLEEVNELDASVTTEHDDYTEFFNETLTADSSQEAELHEESPRLSFVISSIAMNLPLIKSCLEHLVSLSPRLNQQIIVVVNGLNEEITRYLDDVKLQSYPITILNNDINRGFAYSINQALDIVTGEYVCVVHDDAKPDVNTVIGLYKLLERYPDIGLISPKLWHGQTISSPPEANEQEEVSIVEGLESPCFMFRSAIPCRFDTGYHLAWFEGLDFCRQVQNSGYLIGFANGFSIPHSSGTTTTAVGVPRECRLYWNNKKRFEDKWSFRIEETYYLHEDPIDELIYIGNHINPWQPEPFFIERAKKIITSEIKTQLLHMVWDYSALEAMIKLLTVIEYRDVLRNLEEKLNSFSISESLCYRLVYYYYQRTIYSRCSHYLSSIEPSKRSARLKLIQLKLALFDNRLDQTISLVNELYLEYPFNPILLKIIGDLHTSEGNHDDAAFFFSKANELDPFQCVEL